MIESLVVIAIVAVVVSLLFPILHKAKQKAQGLHCMDNLRQLTLAWRMCTEDSDGCLPYAMCSYRSSPNARDAWVLGQLDFNPYNRSNWDLDTDIRKSPLWPYCNESASIWRCPADSSSVKYGEITYPRVRSFSMNFWLGGDLGSSRAYCERGWEGKLHFREEDLLEPGPSRTFVFLDVREDSINSGGFLIQMKGYPNHPELLYFYYDYPASYHNRAGNFSFADGHVEIKRWRDSRTMPPLKRGMTKWALVPSPNNPDLLWLQQRATSLK